MIYHHHCHRHHYPSLRGRQIEVNSDDVANHQHLVRVLVDVNVFDDVCNVLNVESQLKDQLMISMSKTA